MDRKIRVGAVSYLNTRPLLYGIEHSSIKNDMLLTTEYPARIADKLLNDEIDIGLVPVAMLPLMAESHINTRFCIGCDGPVASVCLFSEVPMEEIKTVLLDFQSRTSVALVRILFEKHWNRHPDFKAGENDFISQIQGTTAAVVIGDRALQQRIVSKYVYDLGEAWKEMTSLPFVFAAWISNKKLNETWVNRFNDANALGVNNIRKLLKILPETSFNLQEYYTRYLSYDLTLEKMKGLNLFLSMLPDQKKGPGSYYI